MKVVIVIPTYNEADNIGRMIDALEDEFLHDAGYSYHILIVDGNSPDATGLIVKDKALAYQNITLLPEQKKAGLGAAYIFGFKYALDNLSPDVLVEMDADFQHDPKDVLKLIHPITDGYDYVIGSRFTKGGSIPKEWVFYRKLLSFGGNIFSKFILGIYSINDFTSGFKASRVKGYVDQLNLTDIRSAGFAYKIDLLYKMFKLGARIKEVPIEFGLRDRGSSKMEKSNFIDSLKVVISIRLANSQNLLKFLAVGIVGLVIDTGLFNLLRSGLLSSRNSALVSGLIAMLATFILNNYWSFNERKIESLCNKLLGVTIYIASSSVPIYIRSKLVYYGVSTFGDSFVISNIAFFVGIAFGLVWNFTVYSKIIWRKK